MQQNFTNKNNPLVSVIVPVYKVEAYLEQCLDSILRQTWKNLEIYLIDDGSPDACGRICDRYAEKDSRIRVFHTENKGLSAARNLGIEKAKETNSEYLVFVDSDDWLEDTMIEKLTGAALRSGADIVVCGLVMEFPQRKKVIQYEAQELDSIEATRALLLDEINNHTMNKIWRKSCFEKKQFPEGRVYEDMAILHKVFADSSRVQTIRDVLYHYRNRTDSIVHTINMVNTMDHWESLRERYEYCAMHPAFAEDEPVLDYCMQECISVARRLWRLYYEQPHSERVKWLSKYREAARFVKGNAPAFGKKNWPATLRVSALLARSASPVSFGTAYAMRKMLQLRRGHSTLLYDSENK